MGIGVPQAPRPMVKPSCETSSPAIPLVLASTRKVRCESFGASASARAWADAARGSLSAVARSAACRYVVHALAILPAPVKHSPRVMSVPTLPGCRRATSSSFGQAPA